MRTCFGFVAFSRCGNFDWTQICVNTFRKVIGWDEKLFVVDHNNDQRERKFLRAAGVEILDNHSQYKRHAVGLDLLVKHVRPNYDVLVIIEPDCAIYNRVWLNRLLDAMREGYDMAGAVKLRFGPIHPCGSAWLLKNIPHSFDATMKGQDVNHPMYAQITNMDQFDKDNWTRIGWDVGLKNWFYTAIRGKAKLVNSDGFFHFWGGSQRGPMDIIRNPNLGYGPMLKDELRSVIIKAL